MTEFMDIGFWSEYSIEIAAIISLSYLIGSIPWGLVVGKMAGLDDIRKSGSGNIGATNMLRLGGKKLGLITLILDMGKGALPVFLTYIMITSMTNPQPFMMIAGLSALLGHMFPIWLKFKGGKGVATTLGIYFGFSPVLGLLVCAFWLSSAIVYRISSLAALVAVSIAPAIGSYLFDKEFGVFCIVIMVLIWLKHHANVKRLCLKTEPKIGKSK